MKISDLERLCAAAREKYGDVKCYIDNGTSDGAVFSLDAFGLVWDDRPAGEWTDEAAHTHVNEVVFYEKKGS